MDIAPNWRWREVSRRNIAGRAVSCVPVGDTMRSENIFEAMLDNLSDGVYCTDLDRRIIYWNRTAEELTGYSRDDVVGQRCRDGILVHVNDAGVTLCDSMCPMMSTAKDGAERTAEVYLHHKNGHRIPVIMKVSPVWNNGPGSEIVGIIQVFTDNSPTLAARERIKHLEDLALLDELTRLPNRRYVVRELTSRIMEMARLGEPFGVLFGDIDDFKSVNDSYGHDTGDEVLRVVGRTLLHNCRPLDAIGRWGGEEFVAVVREVDRGQLRVIGERLRALVASSKVTRNGHDVGVTLSVGGTTAHPGDSPESLLERADKMLYRSKQGGRNRVTIFEG